MFRSFHNDKKPCFAFAPCPPISFPFAGCSLGHQVPQGPSGPRGRPGPPGPPGPPGKGSQLKCWTERCTNEYSQWRPKGNGERVDAIITPLGNGSLQAKVVGNRRGVQAVDWQLAKNSPSSVASGKQSVIAGGFNNQASGDNSVVSGGLNNSATAFRSTVGGGSFNVASGEDSTISGGGSNTANSLAATIGGGGSNIAGNEYATIAGGENNQVEGAFASIGGGRDNVAIENYSFVPGGWAGAARLHGQMAHAAGFINVIGDAQRGFYVLRTTTSPQNDSSTLFLDGSSKRLVIPNNSTWAFRAYIVVRNSSGDSRSFCIEGIVKNQNGTISHDNAAPVIYDLGLGSGNVTLFDNQVEKSLDFNVSSGANDNPSFAWVGSIWTTEVKL